MKELEWIKEAAEELKRLQETASERKSEKRAREVRQQNTRLLEEQLKNGQEEARYDLTRCYFREIGEGTRKVDDAIRLWQELAESGNARAEWMLSSVYASLTGNEAATLEWLERSARHGFASAQYAMVEEYVTVDEGTNEYVGKDAKKALPWLKRAAAQRDECMGQRAMLFLGDLYQYGCKEGGIRVDYKKAIEWYRMAAQYAKNFDRKEALVKLAYCYKNSRGANKDLQKAREMFEALAKTGDSTLPYDLELIEWADAGLAACLKEVKTNVRFSEDKN